MAINWRWIRRRLTSRCRHQWATADPDGAKACRRCGIWRWWPMFRRPAHAEGR